MPRVLAVRTREGHYFEFRTLRAETERGVVTVDLDSCPLAEILTVEPAPLASEELIAERRAEQAREPSPQRIDGAGGIDSREAFGQLGG